MLLHVYSDKNGGGGMCGAIPNGPCGMGIILVTNANITIESIKSYKKRDTPPGWRE